MVRVWIAGVAIAVILGSVAWGTLRVDARAATELEDWSDERTLAGPRDASGRVAIGEVALTAGQNVSFEVCSADGFPASRWLDAATFAVWPRGSDEVVIQTSLAARRLAGARRLEHGACLEVGSGPLQVTGRYVVGALVPSEGAQAAVRAVPLRAHVIATTPLDRGDVAPLRVILVTGLLALFALALPRRRVAASLAPPRASILRVVAATLVLFAAFLAVGLVPVEGSRGVLVRGLLLAGTQIVLALALTPRPRGPLLGLLPGWEKPAPATPPGDVGVEEPPPGPSVVTVALAAARALGVALLGVALSIGAGRVADLIPSTSVAPVEQLVSWPSAGLALGTIGVLVPLAEETFFRGFVYGVVAARYGRAIGFTVAVLLFGLAHLPQTWGAWGAALAVTLTGAVLTAIRAWSRSVYVSALAHLAYNGLITMLSLG